MTNPYISIFFLSLVSLAMINHPVKCSYHISKLLHRTLFSLELMRELSNIRIIIRDGNGFTMNIAYGDGQIILETGPPGLFEAKYFTKKNGLVTVYC